MLRNGTLTSVCALLLWLGGCPKRQEPKSIVVYVPAHAPAHAPASASAATESQVLVIEEPAPPPEPEETLPAEIQGPAKNATGGGKSAGHHAHSLTPTEPDIPTVENPEPPPAEVPALEPRESSAEATELQGNYQKVEQDIRQRLTRLSGARLSANERKTLEDARTFFVQATRAKASGDLPRALNLARKASLLLAALE